MKARSLPFIALLPIAILFSACTSDAITDSLFISYGPVSISVEKAGGEKTLSGNITVRLVNRTEKQMNVGFLEAVLMDANSGEALVRFRPIIPDSYGSISTARLLPKESRDVPVVLPLGLTAFDSAKHPTVIVEISLQTTDGYRTDERSNPVAVTTK